MRISYLSTRVSNSIVCASVTVKFSHDSNKNLQEQEQYFKGRLLNI